MIIQRPMKLLSKFKESFIANLQYLDPGVVRVQSEISRILWPDARETPKRKVEGYYPRDYFAPIDWEWKENRDIRSDDDTTGHSLFSYMSMYSKTHYLLKKYLPPIRPLYVPSPKARGSWYIPCYSSVQRDLEVTNRANRYLNHQEHRIQKAISEGNYELSTRIWTVLAQRSWCFRVSSLHSTKCVKGWYYMMSTHNLGRMLQRVDDILRTWSSNVKYFRVYIPKPDGKRFRPLGVPSKPWAIVLHMVYRYLVLVIKDRISINQFGFLPKRNGVQAWREIIRKRKEEGLVHMYEFDLDGCFNRISIAWTLKLLHEIGLPQYFVFYIEKLLTAVPIYEGDWKPEIEIRKIRNMTVKTGLPQGFSLSPLLSILVIDAAFKAIGEDPILYADDGIIMKETREDLTADQIDMLKRWGLVLSSKRKKDGTAGCKWIDDEFTFLGIKYSVKRDAFHVELESDRWSWIPSDKMTDDMFWNEIETYSGPPEWTWQVDPDSLAMRGKSVSSYRNWKLLQRWVDGSKMVKRFGMIFLDIQKESSWCSMALLDYERRRTSDTRIKRVRMSDKYVVPLFRIQVPSNPLPGIEVTYRPYEYEAEIRNPVSPWLQMDELKRKSLEESLYTHVVMYENNISSWRTKEYAEWEPLHITTIEDTIEAELGSRTNVRLTDDSVPSVSFFNQWVPARSASSYPEWNRISHMIKTFTASMFITFFWMVGTKPGEATRAILWHINNLIRPDWSDSLLRYKGLWVVEPYDEIVDKAPSPGYGWVDFLLLLIIMAIIGFIWYRSYPDSPPPRHISPEVGQNMTEVTKEFTAQRLELSEIKTLIIESPYLPDLGKIDALQSRLQSISDTLFIIRKENISLTKSLRNKTTELLDTNVILDRTRAELEQAADRLHRLSESAHLQDHGTNFATDELLSVLECPAFTMLREVNEITNWDAHAISILSAAQALELDPATGDIGRESLFNVITLIRDFITDHLEVEAIAELTSNL